MLLFTQGFHLEPIADWIHQLKMHVNWLFFSRFFVFSQKYEQFTWIYLLLWQKDWIFNFLMKTLFIYLLFKTQFSLFQVLPRFFTIMFRSVKNINLWPRGLGLRLWKDASLNMSLNHYILSLCQYWGIPVLILMLLKIKLKR